MNVTPAYVATGANQVWMRVWMRKTKRSPFALNLCGRVLSLEYVSCRHLTQCPVQQDRLELERKITMSYALKKDEEVAYTLSLLCLAPLNLSL